MSDGALAQAKDKPYIFAILTGVAAIFITGVIMAWGNASPEAVLIGLEGRHDGIAGEERLAACLDCHVPFVGTPGSRCLGPGCHGELATGTPPREGRSMPIRFHTVLRDRPCGMCHQEHVESGTRTATRAFTHAMIPEGVRPRCSRCHSASVVASHARADAVECGVCHDVKTWRGVPLDHGRVNNEACDLCHVAPDNPTHASVAGTCNECHETTTWTPRAPAP